MNLKILFVLLVYWSAFLVIFAVGGDTILEDQLTSVDADFNSSAMGFNETSTTGGIFGSGISFGRWFAFATFGIGLVNAPSWFAVVFASWQTMMSIFTIGWIISSIWNG